MNLFTANILSWYNKNKKQFPCRDINNPYEI